MSSTASSAAGANAAGSGTEMEDLVATWNVPMSEKVYKIEFEHGTTTGKRILRVNGKV
jgi:hypothetical protein